MNFTLNLFFLPTTFTGKSFPCFIKWNDKRFNTKKHFFDLVCGALDINYVD